VLFYAPGCEGCYDVKDVALPRAAGKFGQRILIEKHDINNMEMYKVLLEYEKFYNSKENETLKVFAGSRYLAGPKEIVSKIEDVVADELAKGAETFTPISAKEPEEAGDVPEIITEQFRTFNALLVAGNGLVDGVNPCAFTAIIFFISLLAYLGKSRREMLTVGLGFSASVFLTYLLLGFGAMQAIKIFSVSHGVSRAITIVTAALALLLALLSFLDYVNYRRSGDPKDMKLGLPQSIKVRIRKVMRTRLTTRNLLVGSVVIGFLVSLLESVCTGQMYLPTIVFVLKEPALRLRALAYLVLYNVMFIVPLVVIFVVAYLGVGSERLGRFLRRNLGAFKLAMSVLFAALGVLLLTTL
jgi:cytochrome c biogenesis protein CcdA